jgi:cation transporter-like permease
MTTSALIFMLASWAFVLSLMTWAFRRIMGHRAHHDPDGIGPAQPPEPPLTETR